MQQSIVGWSCCSSTLDTRIGSFCRALIDGESILIELDFDVIQQVVLLILAFQTNRPTDWPTVSSHLVPQPLSNDAISVCALSLDPIWSFQIKINYTTAKEEDRSCLDWMERMWHCVKRVIPQSMWGRKSTGRRESSEIERNSCPLWYTGHQGALITGSRMFTLTCISVCVLFRSIIIRDHWPQPQKN